MTHVLLYGIASLAAGYLVLSLILTYLVQQYPRNPVTEAPDWGTVQDISIPTQRNGSLEVWRIEPDVPSRGIVVLAHGWGRNRDRMVGRARVFGRLGFTTVIHSARDHGHSSSQHFMNALKFCEDIEAVLVWIGKPVVLYGHSAGAGGAILAASRNADRIRLLFLEGCYPYTKQALLNLYRWFNPYFGIWFGPAIVFWMDRFYRTDIDSTSPAVLAPNIVMPVLLIHGENDQQFPADFAHTLYSRFRPGQAELFIAPGAGHSTSSQSPGYVQAVTAFLNRHDAEIRSLQQVA